jgi:hypothetical protein
MAPELSWRGGIGIVVWIEKSAVCHSCESRNPEKIFLSHPEFISGSTKKMLKRVQHDKKSLDSCL